MADLGQLDIPVNRWGDAGADILADMERVMEQMREVPPPPFLASSTMLSADRALHFKQQGRSYVGAGPGFWAKVPEAAAPFPGSIWRLEIVNLDVDAEARCRFFEAMAAAMGGEKP